MSASKPPEMSKTEPDGADSDDDPGYSFQSFLRGINNKPKKNTYVNRVGPSGAEMLLLPTRKEYVSGLARPLARLLALDSPSTRLLDRKVTKAERADRERSDAIRRSYPSRDAYLDEYLDEESRALSNRLEGGRRAGKEAIENLCRVSEFWSKSAKEGKGKLSAEAVKAGMAALVKQGDVEGDEKWRERKSEVMDELDRVMKEEEKRTTGEAAEGEEEGKEEGKGRGLV